MKKIITIAAAALGVGLFAAPASAGVISFSDLASGNEGGVQNFSTFSVDGVNISHLAGFNLQTGPGSITMVISSGPTGPFFSYYDDTSGGQPGGLGVCRALSGAAGTTGPGADCADSGDDSIDGEGGIDEAIIISFSDGPFNIRELSFRDGQHNDITNSNGMVEWGAATTGGTIGGITTFANLVAMAIAGDFDGTTDFALGYVDTEFYLEAISDVPIPGAIPLLLSGIAGLGFASRKKKTA